MKLSSGLVFAALALATTLPAFAQTPATQPNWLTRCNRQLNQNNNDQETGRYIYETRGKDAGGAARAYVDFNASGSAHAAVYLTDAKDLMNPYGGASLSVSYYTSGDFKAAPTIGQVSFRASARDFKPIPGPKAQVKLLVDGKAFGPYEPKESSHTDGMYSVWLDTADTDGDSKPPTLKPAEFAALAKAVDAMKTAEVVLVQNAVDIVKMPVPITKRIEWRDGLAAWAQGIAKGVPLPNCLDKIVN